MSVDHASFVSAIQPILAEIFNEEPVREHERFVASAAFELRKALQPDSTHEYITVYSPLAPDWMAAPSLSIGPYEDRLLHQLVFDSHGLSVVRGGTGSGKTSLVRMISKHAKAISQYNHWKEKYGTSNFVWVIDFQAASVDFRESVDENKGQQSQLHALLDHTCDYLTSILSRATGNDFECMSSLFESALWEDNDEYSDTETDIDTVRFKLQSSMEISRTEWARLDSRSKCTLWEKAVRSLDNHHHRVIARLLPFASLGRRHLVDDRAFVLVLDNLDPLPSYLQVQLYRSLYTFFAAEETARCGFNIALFLRLSSAVDPIAAIKDLVVAAHGCPSPADLVFFRLSQFLLKPRAISAFARLGAELQQCIQWRLLVLWVALADVRSDFNRLVDALAGTNIRNAFGLVKKWCCTEHLPTNRMIDINQSTVQQLLCNVLTEFLCNGMGRAFARGIRMVLGKSVLRDLLTAGPITNATENAAKKISEVVFHVLCSTGLVPLVNTKPNARTAVATSVSEWITSSGKDATADNLVWTQELTTLLDSLSNVVEGLPDADGDRPSASSLSSEILNILEKTLLEYCCTTAEARGLEMSAAGKWKIAHLLKSSRAIIDAYPPNLPHIKVIPKPNNATANIRNRVFSREMPPPSGYAVSSPLLDVNESDSVQIICSEDRQSHELPSAINCLSLDGDSITPAVLRVLAKLQTQSARRDGSSPITVALLEEDFERHGFRKEDLRAALEAMIRPERRLIFSGISDWFDGAERLYVERHRPLVLSWAGFGYARDLLRLPVFLQWSLKGVKQIEMTVARRFGEAFSERDLTLFNRLRATLIGFECLLEDEYRRLGIAWDRLCADKNEDTIQRLMARAEPIKGSSAIDMFFGTMRHFMNLLWAHHKRVAVDSRRNESAQVREANKEAIADLAREWIAVGDDYRKKYSEVLEFPSDLLLDWNYDIEISHQFVSRMLP